MTAHPRPIVYLLGTGGTIATLGTDRMDGTEYGASGTRVPLQEMLDGVPETADFARVNAEQFINVGSNRVEPDHWLGLARRINEIFRTDPDAVGVAVTHGTATLEETAYFLNLTVDSPRPVVVTGAMRPRSAMGTDADVNLLNAIQVAACPEAAGKGVLVVMNNEIHAARNVTKTHTYRVETFKSGEFGFLGYADSDHKVVFYQEPARRHTHGSELRVEGVSQLPRVDIAYASAGGDGASVRDMTERGVAGIVSAGLGSGGTHPDFTQALEEARAQDIIVVVAAHVGEGRVISTRSTKEQGFVASDNLSPKKARILLMLALTLTDDVEPIQKMFYTY